ncbi:hypothetical protein HG531_001765 [Fusarium graminearum]|nr:hypothetical protein HG531_001765 [Fusarium graminearum]
MEDPLRVYDFVVAHDFSGRLELSFNLVKVTVQSIGILGRAERDDDGAGELGNIVILPDQRSLTVWPGTVWLGEGTALVTSRMIWLRRGAADAVNSGPSTPTSTLTAANQRVFLAVPARKDDSSERLPARIDSLSNSANDLVENSGTTVRVTSSANDPGISMVSNNNDFVGDGTVDNSNDIPDRADAQEFCTSALNSTGVSRRSLGIRLISVLFSPLAIIARIAVDEDSNKTKLLCALDFQASKDSTVSGNGNLTLDVNLGINEILVILISSIVNIDEGGSDVSTGRVAVEDGNAVVVRGCRVLFDDVLLKRGLECGVPALSIL